MAVATYYFGWNTLAEWAIEPQTAFGLPMPTENMNSLAHLRSASININENMTRISSVGAAVGRSPQSNIKGKHEASGTLTFWLPDDLDSTTLDVWILKMGLDAFNVAHSGTAWVVPNTSTSIYPSNNMASFNLEIGHNPSTNKRVHHLTGCSVNDMTVNVTKEEPVEFILNYMARRIYPDQSTYTDGSETQSTAQPFKWANCEIEYGDDNSTTPRNDFTALSFNFNHNLVANYDIAESSATIDALDVTTSWNASSDATLAVDTTNFKEGVAGMSMAKSGTSETALSADKSITGTDLSNKVVYLWVYIDDATTLTAIDVGAAGNNNVVLGTTSSNTNIYNMGTGLAVGWNLITMDVESPDSTGGSGADETDIDFVDIVFKSDASGDTWTTGKLVVDYLRLSTPRSPNNFIPGVFTGTGEFTLNMTTTAGMEIFREIADDTGDPVEMQDTADSKEILLRVRRLTASATQNIIFRLRDVQIGELPKDFDPEVVDEISVPFTFQYYHFTITTPDTSAPVNFDDQS